MNATFVLPDLKLGGAQVITLKLANGLDAEGYDVDILVRNPNGEIKDKISNGVKIRRLKESKYLQFAGVFSTIPHLRKYMSENKKRIVFVNLHHYAVCAQVANYFLSTPAPYIPIIHNTLSKHVSSYKMTHLVSRALQSIDNIIVVSEGIKNDLVNNYNIPEANIHVVYNPAFIEATVDDQCEFSTSYILSVGRICEDQKDFFNLIKAFQIVSEWYTGDLIIIGTGPDENKLKNLAKELEIEDSIQILGYIEDIRPFINNADLFVLSSKYEGLPTVLIEAMSLGCPVVSSDCPSGPNEILCNGKYGELVPVGDTSELARAIQRELNSPTKEDQLVNRAREFSLEKILPKYIEFIEYHNM